MMVDGLVKNSGNVLTDCVLGGRIDEGPLFSFGIVDGGKVEVTINLDKYAVIPLEKLDDDVYMSNIRLEAREVLRNNSGKEVNE